MVKLNLKHKEEYLDFKWPIDYLFGFVAIIYFLVFVQVMYLYQYTELFRFAMYPFSWDRIRGDVLYEIFLFIVAGIFLYLIVSSKVRMNSNIKQTFFYFVVIPGIYLFVLNIIDITDSYLWDNLNLARFLFFLPFAFWGIVSIYLFRNRQYYI
jgi:hypothetical protein